MDLTFKELDKQFKTYSELNVAQCQISLRPGTRKDIKAFVLWARDEVCLGRDPNELLLHIHQISDLLIRRYKRHKKFQTDSKTLAEAPAKPEKFKESFMWEDWKRTFLNYLRSIPGRDDIPLKYICQ